MKQKFDIFWKQHGKTKPDGYYTTEFKDLVNSCFYYDPNERPSINDLEQLPWMQQGTPTKEEVQAELFKRFSAIKQA